ncbi:MAG: peptidase E [Myxococcota bacterium]
MQPEPTIFALGGGGGMMEPDNPLLDDFMLSLADVDAPKIALLPTAAADSDNTIRRFYDAFVGKARPSYLPLYRRDRPAEMLLEQDIIFVTGGNTVNALAIWRAHGVDTILRQCWEKGIVLAGISAGSLCWFHGGITDSFRVKEMDPLLDGLGFLPGSHCPHYDGEPQRRPLYTRFVSSGTIPPGVAATDGAGLLYRGTTLKQVVTSQADAAAWRVDEQGQHHPLPATWLGRDT